MHSWPDRSLTPPTLAVLPSTGPAHSCPRPQLALFLVVPALRRPRPWPSHPESRGPGVGLQPYGHPTLRGSSHSPPSGLVAAPCTTIAEDGNGGRPPILRAQPVATGLTRPGPPVARQPSPAHGAGRWRLTRGGSSALRGKVGWMTSALISFLHYHDHPAATTRMMA